METSQRGRPTTANQPLDDQAEPNQSTRSQENLSLRTRITVWCSNERRMVFLVWLFGIAVCIVILILVIYFTVISLKAADEELHETVKEREAWKQKN